MLFTIALVPTEDCTFSNISCFPLGVSLLWSHCWPWFATTLLRNPSFLAVSTFLALVGQILRAPASPPSFWVAHKPREVTSATRRRHLRPHSSSCSKQKGPMNSRPAIVESEQENEGTNRTFKRRKAQQPSKNASLLLESSCRRHARTQGAASKSHGGTPSPPVLSANRSFREFRRVALRGVSRDDPWQRCNRDFLCQGAALWAPDDDDDCDKDPRKPLCRLFHDVERSTQ